jgi:cell surface protein SprA
MGSLLPENLPSGKSTLGYVKEVVIGVRNSTDDDLTGPYSGEIWVNELRMVGLEEKGGVGVSPGWMLPG